jgi:hypothetical protein
MLKSGFLLAALIATAATTLAVQPARAEARVKVPFNFTIDGKLCPAGVYRVKSDAGDHAVTLVGRDSAKTFSWVVMPVTGSDDPNRVVLQFNQAGTEHTLRSIQYGAQSTSRLDKQQGASDETEDTVRGGR